MRSHKRQDTIEGTLPGPSKTITVEPLRIPKAPALPRREPEPLPERPEREPARKPEREPVRAG
ncbi:MAG TPA: hypothetical protein VMB27_01090 [Solirubrobacteraceae bacterium]|nr:hypothetical protein [Solirubrobacteraceae bacterium]